MWPENEGIVAVPPLEALTSNLITLQKTYINLLEQDEQDAYTEAGLTLRNYSDSLSLMCNVNLDHPEDEDSFDENDDD